MLAPWKRNFTLWASLFAVTAGARIGSPSTPDLNQHEHQYASRQTFNHRTLKKAETVGNNGSPSSNFPLAECQGDCDSDDECSGSLKCMQRSGNENVPGCDVSSRDEGQDFCYDPSSGKTDDGGEDDVKLPPAGTLDRVGNNGDPSSVFPLRECLGDCDSDDDCKGSLKCFQRSSGEQEPPGCEGETDGSTDYCYDPDNNDGEDGNDGGPTSGSFRLQMYWRPGYYWQEKTYKTEWCMQCQGRKGNDQCRSGDDIEISHCDHDSTGFELLNRDGSDAQLKIAGTDLCLEMVGKKNYFGRRRRAIEVRGCSSSNDDQYFKADWGNDHFAVETNNNDGCLSQDHHPKDHEDIFSEDCDRAADSHTLYWIMF